MEISDLTNELCSVIMPAYNAKKYIADAIKSVTNQTYENIELIIVDDCSNDGTRSIIDKWSRYDSRIKPIFNKTNIGCAESRNKALKASRGEYVAFIDSDDIWELNKLEVQLTELKKRKGILSYTAFQMIDSSGRCIKKREVIENVTLDLLLRENYICCSSVVLIGYIARNHYMISNYFHEDYCYWLNLLEEGYLFCGINKFLVKYRLSSQNRSKNKINAAWHRWRIYREYLRMSIWDSIRYIGMYLLNGIRKYYL